MTPRDRLGGRPAVLLLAAATILAGCSGLPETPPATAPASPTANPATPSPTAAATVVRGLQRLQEFAFHVTDELPRFEAATSAAIADGSLTDLRRWAQTELAWVVAHPPHECYQGGYDSWKAMVEIMTGDPSGDEIHQATEYLTGSLDALNAAIDRCL